MSKRLATTVGFMGVAAWLLLSPHGQAGQQTNTPSKVVQAKNDQSTAQPYLGIGVQSVHPGLAKNIPELKGRGVLIAEVVKDSPAEKAGIKPFDILVGYGEHQVYSPEQLIKLVQSDKPGRTVPLEVISSGKEAKVKVTLGEHQRISTVGNSQPKPSFNPWPEMKDSAWDSFESMTLSRVDDKHFKADIKYKNDKGQLEQKHFEGSRQEIHKAIEKEKDLPAREREQLLRALDLRPPMWETPFPFPQFTNPNGSILWDFEDLGRHFLNHPW